MSQSSNVPREEYLAQMKAEMETYLASVMNAVNQAPDGEWIAGSEEQVRDLSAEFRRQAFERACRCVSTGRKPLFPPPHNPATGKRLANKGRQSRTLLTINGRVELVRRWWHSSETCRSRARGGASRSSGGAGHTGRAQNGLSRKSRRDQLRQGRGEPSSLSSDRHVW